MSLSDCQYCKVEGGDEEVARPSKQDPTSPILNRLAILFPPLNWIPASSLSAVAHDLWSGLLRGFYSFSSVLCLSLLSGSSPQAGISSLALHQALWGIFSPHISLSPSLSPLICLLVAQSATTPASMFLVSVVCGSVQIFAALLPSVRNLLLLPFPSSVRNGAIVAATILGTSYSSGLLLGALNPSSPSFPLHNIWHQIITSHHLISPLPAALGLSLLSLLITIRRLAKFSWCETPDPSSLTSRGFRAAKLSLTFSSPAVALLFSSLIAFSWPSSGLRLASPLPNPGWSWPQLSPFIFTSLSPALTLIPPLSIALLPQSKASKDRRTLLLLGIGTLLSTLTGGFPLTASTSSPSSSSPLANLFSSLLLLITLPLLQFLLPLLPTSALGAVLLARVAFDIDPSQVLGLWRYDSEYQKLFHLTILYDITTFRSSFIGANLHPSLFSLLPLVGAPGRRSPCHRPPPPPLHLQLHRL